MSEKDASSSTSEGTKAEEEEVLGSQRTSLLAEFIEYLMDNKKWWMIPIVLTMVLIGFIFLLGGTALAPFIYSLF